MCSSDLAAEGSPRLYRICRGGNRLPDELYFGRSGTGRVLREIMMEDVYESPFSGRYSSEEMLRLFSKRTRHETWRRLWVELARAERELGLPIRQEQVDELAAHVGDIDYAVVEAKEREIRHDVMAHIYAYGLVCPNAAGILHLGATSCYVTDNADLVLYRDALRLIRAELIPVLRNLRDFAQRYQTLPTLRYSLDRKSVV